MGPSQGAGDSGRRRRSGAAAVTGGAVATGAGDTTWGAAAGCRFADALGLGDAAMRHLQLDSEPKKVAPIVAPRPPAGAQSHPLAPMAQDTLSYRDLCRAASHDRDLGRALKATGQPDEYKIRIWTDAEDKVAEERAAKEIFKFCEANGYSSWKIVKKRHIWIPVLLRFHRQVQPRLGVCWGMACA